MLIASPTSIGPRSRPAIPRQPSPCPEGRTGDLAEASPDVGGVNVDAGGGTVGRADTPPGLFPRRLAFRPLPAARTDRVETQVDTIGEVARLSGSCATRGWQAHARRHRRGPSTASADFANGIQVFPPAS